jgi:putative transposase
MTNHLHLLLTPSQRDACAALMKNVGQHYVQYVNRVHGRTGTLWEGRFRSSVAMSAEYVLACYRYIELNPVRGGLSNHPREYRWSSHLHNAEGVPDSLLVPHPVYEVLESSPLSRQKTYRALFETPLETEVLNEIRGALRIGRELGTEARGRGRPAKNGDRPHIPQGEK